MLRPCEIDVFPKMVVCACTSAESHKRQRLGEELAKSNEALFITTANTRVSEKVFNQLRKPGLIAALKIIQQIPDSVQSIEPFVIGVMGAELGRQFPQASLDQIVETAANIYTEMDNRQIPFTLTATDVVLHADHPSIIQTAANINQPGDVSDEQLKAILESKVGDCGNPCLQGGLIPAKFTVGMAACEINVNTGEVLGQSGQVEAGFSFRPISVQAIEEYVAKHGERARQVNGGIMWEYWHDYIEIINGIGRGDNGFEAEMEHLMAMTSGIPTEMSGFLYDLSQRNHLTTPGCTQQATSEVRRLTQTHLGRSLPKTVKWCSWYPNYSKK